LLNDLNNKIARNANIDLSASTILNTFVFIMALNVYKNNKYKKCLRNNNLIHIFKTEKRGSACKNQVSLIYNKENRQNWCIHCGSGACLVCLTVYVG